MKSIFLAVFLLFGCVSAFAQPICDSSFYFFKPDNAKVAIQAAPGHSLNELYDTSGFTWEAWVYLDDTLGSNYILMGTEDSIVYQDIFIAMGWGWTSGINSRITFLVSTNTGYTTVSIHGSTRLMPSRWYHVAAVCDYHAGTMSLYLDGTNIGTGPMPFTQPNRLVRNIYTSLGNFNSENWRSFNGKLDEVKFWKGVRTPSDILLDSAGCTAPFSPNLKAYFKAREGSGTHAASMIDTNFRGVNTARWETNAPVAVCGSCCEEGTSPKANITTPSLTVCDTTTDSVKIVVRVTHLAPGTPWTVTLSDGSVASGVAGSGAYDSVIIKVHPAATTTYSVTTSSIMSQPCATIAGIMTVTIIQCSKNVNHTGVEEYGTGTNCSVYPNPGTGQFTVSLNGLNDAQLFTVADVNGQVIKRSEIKGDTFNFDISNMAAGVYNVIITGDHSVITRRVVVTK